MSQALTALLSKKAGTGEPFLFPGPAVPIVFNFDQGLAAPETFPTAKMIELSQELFQRDGSDILDYFDPDVGYEELVFGSRGLRTSLASRYRNKHGRDLGPENFIITSGSVQALSLAMSALLNPGDVAVVEASSFPYAINYMESSGAEVVTVPVDDDGMHIDSLENVLASCASQGKRVKLVYTISTFQMPTGAVLSLERRKRLLSLAEQHDFVIIEDYVYGELRYEGEEIPSLLSLDTSGRVLHDNSFSKTLAPGVRIGWMCGDTTLINALGAVREDLGVSQWMARLVQAFLDQDLYDEHLTKARKLYCEKRDATIDAVERYCGDYLTFSRPKGSFYLWAEVDQSVDWIQAARMAEQHGIFFRPGERFDTVGDGRQFIRLAFGRVSFDVIEQGIKRLGTILESCLRK